MDRPHSCPRRHAPAGWPLVLLPLALALLSPAARPGGGDPILYALNERGRLTVNGTVLETLPGKFDPSSTQDSNGEQRWIELAVSGPDRWALRLDGLLFKNGVKLTSLPFTLGTGVPVWARLAVAGAGVLALRTDGMIHDEDGAFVNYPPGSSFFSDLVAIEAPAPEGAEPDVFALRFDGFLFTGSTSTPAGRFVGGDGLTPGQDDGKALDTVWVRLTRDPTSGDLFGLRSDGQVHRIDPDVLGAEGTDPPEGVLVAALPFPDTLPELDQGDLYVDLLVDAAGTFYALAQNGRVFRADDILTPFATFPGFNLGDTNTWFFDISELDGVLYTLQANGRLFQGTRTEELLKLPGNHYLRLVAADTPPDLTNFDNNVPRAAIYKTRTVEGSSTTIPIVLSDIDKVAADLLVSVDVTLIPGAVVSQDNTSVTLDGTQAAGKYRFTVTADDGIAKPKVFKYAVKVRPPDLVPEKNRPPLVTKVKPVQGLVGIPLVLPILAFDKDGDVVEVTAVDDKGAFLLGATFDEGTDTFSWTPEFAHVGKTTAAFLVSDGTKTKKLKLKITVVSPLIF